MSVHLLTLSLVAHDVLVRKGNAAVTIRINLVLCVDRSVAYSLAVQVERSACSQHCDELATRCSPDYSLFTRIATVALVLVGILGQLFSCQAITLTSASLTLLKAKILASICRLTTLRRAQLL